MGYQAKKGMTILVGIITLQRKELGELLYNEIKRICGTQGITGTSLRASIQEGNCSNHS